MNDELLIELVRERPFLYDVEDPKYMDTEWKRTVWKKIGSKMNIDGSKCKTRWNNIRDNYRKSLSKRKSTSGQSAKKIKPYRYEKQLEFLRQYITEREPKWNIEMPPDVDDSELDDDIEQRETMETADSLDSPQPDTAIQQNPEIIIDDLDSPQPDTVSQMHIQQNPEIIIDDLDSPQPDTVSQLNPEVIIDIPTSSSVPIAKYARQSAKKKKPPESAASTLLEYLLQRNQEEKNSYKTGLPTATLDNPVDSFLYGLSFTLKSLTPYLLNRAKSEIFSTVQKYELQMIKQQYHYPTAPEPSSQPAFQLAHNDDNSSSQHTENVREYVENFNEQQE